MKAPVHSRPLKLMLLIWPAVLLAACTALQPASPEERVAQRAQERWNHLIAGDYASAYAYLSAAQRSAGSLEAYQRHFMLSKVRWNEASVVGVECGEAACTAQIRLDLTVVQPMPRVPAFDASQTIEEQWVFADGDWWFVPD